MTRQSSRLALKASILLLCLGMTASAYAQSARQTQRIVSVVEDAGNQFVLINTSQLVPLSAPTVTYLPVDGGETVMIVDFHGLAFPQPPKVFFSPCAPAPCLGSQTSAVEAQQSPGRVA